MTPSLANTRADFIFTGRTSHAAASPHLGRSALDAVELMNVGVNYMREHMPSDARVHYALLDTGGIAPNVVQAHARVRYSIRARDLPGMNELVGRVHKIAQGAALMTETKVEMRIISAVSNVLPNTPLEQALHRIMEDLGPPHFDEADKRIRRKDPRHPDRQGYRVRLSHDRHGPDRPAAGRFHRAARRQAQSADRLDRCRRRQLGGPDRSGPCADGRDRHAVPHLAGGGAGQEPAAHKAMVQAAKAMAGLGVKALNEPELIEAAKADLKKRTARTPYVSPLPDNVAPPLDMSVN